MRPLLFACALAFAACSSPQIPPLDFAKQHAPKEREVIDAATTEQLLALEKRLGAGEFEAVLHELESMVEARPGLAEAWTLLGLTQLELAYQDLQAGNKNNATVDNAALTLAESSLRTARRLAPDMIGVDRALAVLFEREGHLEAAYAAATRVLTRRAFDAEALLSAARCAAELGWERRTVIHLDALRSLRPQPTEALALETAVYRRLALGSDEQELRTRWYERLYRAWNDWSERSPKDARGPRGLAATLQLRIEQFGGSYSKDRIAQISALYAKATGLAPSDPALRFEHGHFLEKIGDLAGAERQYRRALDFDAKHLPSLLNLAALLWESERRHEARLYWQRALAQISDAKERARVQQLLGTK
ncbi:MAG: hypothetical protein CSA62_02270 [Planctomycetota bacterium]|nr:MAG: hypothetical protein CSA62_02270 [Planctomycetota bacterium]